MAAEAAEAKLTEHLRNEIGKVDKECVRPLQVRVHVFVAKGPG
jgi:chorismate mutase